MPQHAPLLRRGFAALVLSALPLAACSGRGAKAPRVPPAADATIAIEGSIRGVAGDGASAYAAVALGDSSAVHAYRNGALTWKTPIGGTAGPLAITGALAGAAVSAKGTLEAVALRADPAAALIALDRGSGAKRWTVVFDSTEWAVISAVAPLGDGFVVGGLFGGTLRAGDRVVSSAGGSDGFVARLGGKGEIVWLVRVGGAGADGVQGVATRGDGRGAKDPERERIAIAGTFSTGAELLGHALPPHDARSPFGDAFAAELDAKGARKWSATFGGRADDTVAGVAIDGRGHVVVAGSAREVVHVGSAQLVAQGEGDGIVVWFGEGGEKGASVLVGGLDFDGLRAITAVGDRVIVGGFFSGSIKLADRALTAGGGDDAFLAALDPNGTVAVAWHVGGEGREEIGALSAIPGGFVAGIAHTAAASVEAAALASPKDPMLGGALIVRGVQGSDITP